MQMKNFFTIALLVPLLSGCFGIFGKPRPDGTRVYLLGDTSVDVQCPSRLFQPKHVVAIGPIGLPEYLNRPHLVRKDSRGVLHQSNFRRWGEPLGNGLNRILLSEMRHVLSDDHIVAIPWNGRLRPDYLVHITVDDWLHTASKGIIFRAHCEFWTGDRLIASKMYGNFIPLRGKSWEAMISAMHHMAIGFAREIADDLSRMEEEVDKSNGKITEEGTCK
jgi:uncharacterized lipoprotein YmbA